MDEMDKTPKQIVAELNKYVIGQDAAKKSIAVALRNRYRRMQVPTTMRDEITPKNVLMIGPTGVGKTEIARRLAKIVNAPFVKVEATKFTEVGYVGRDVESMVRDLVEVAYKMEQDAAFARVRDKAAQRADEDLVRVLVPAKPSADQQKQAQERFTVMMRDLQRGKMPDFSQAMQQETEEDHLSPEVQAERQRVRQQLQNGELEDRDVTVQVTDPGQSVGNNDMLGQMGIDLSAMQSMLPQRRVTRTMPVAEAREVFIREESAQLVNDADLAEAAIKRAENTGIVFIDEIDKITATGQRNSGEVSREGVQRDILPIVEGSQVKTKYGMVSTDHMLFIASGAFHESKPSDLIAELQGRFPIRVELDDLGVDDFVKILTEPQNALVKQYMALIATDNVKVTFTIEAIQRIAQIAYDVNHDTDNIGARRLHTILERLLEDLLYEGPDMGVGEVTITAAYVDEKIGKIAKNQDLSRYIL